MDEYRMKTDEDLQREVDEETFEAVRGFDYESAQLLMAVIEKQASVSPRSTSIAGLAAKALDMLNSEAKAIAEERAQLMNAKVAERTMAENERIAALQQEERDQAEANKAAAENAKSNEVAAARHRAEVDEAAKVPLTPQPGSPRAAPNSTMADNRRM